MPRLFFHPRLLDYTFPSPHPFQSVRLKNAFRLMQAEEVTGFEDFPDATLSELQTFHTPEYLDVLQKFDREPHLAGDVSSMEWGLGPGDTKPFRGIWQACLSSAGATLAGARALVSGEELAISISGGFHHARPDRASGFCAVGDLGIAIHELLKKFDRVAYVDIDVHHGDGLYFPFENDPRVFTASIHQFGYGFYPNTGHFSEVAVNGSSLNIPCYRGLPGDMWLSAFRELVIPALEKFEPPVIVLQMGADAHAEDKLGRLQVWVQEWLEAVRLVQNLRVPLLATGGGGYALYNPPRMWTAAVLTLLGREVPEKLPEDLAAEIGVETYFDREYEREFPVEARYFFEEMMEFNRLLVRGKV